MVSSLFCNKTIKKKPVLDYMSKINIKHLLVHYSLKNTTMITISFRLLTQPDSYYRW